MKPMGSFIHSFGHMITAALVLALSLLFFPKETNRSPASAVNEVVDYSGYSGNEFKIKATEHIVSSAQFIRGSETYRVQLGHVFGPGRSVSMCEIYQNIVIVMKADGIAIHGEAPTVTVTAPCSAEKAATLTNEIVIPYKELTAQKAEDGEFEYEDVKIQASYLTGEWPYQLYVQSISLIGDEVLNITQDNIMRLNHGNFTLSW